MKYTFSSASELWKGTKEGDYSDLLHPCAWLEVQRGMRSLWFLWCFIGLHLVLCAAIILALNPASDMGPDSRRIVFWCTIVPAFLFVMPLRALFAMREDMNRGTVELLMFTQIRPDGVVTGKWLSFVFEIVLMACTLTPYLVLHYFGSGANPLFELTMLAGLCMASFSLCAVGVMISIIRSPVKRIVAILVIAMFGPAIVYQLVGLLVMFVFIVGNLAGTLVTAITGIRHLDVYMGIACSVLIGVPAFTAVCIILPLRIGTQWIDEQLRGYLRQ